MQLTNIRIIYCSRYNGCTLVTETDDTYELNEFPEFSDRADAVQSTIVDLAYEDCDEDGEFQGSIMKLSQDAIAIAKKEFGDEGITYVFEEDDMSS